MFVSTIPATAGTTSAAVPTHDLVVVAHGAGAARADPLHGAEGENGGDWGRVLFGRLDIPRGREEACEQHVGYVRVRVGVRGWNGVGEACERHVGYVRVRVGVRGCDGVGEAGWAYISWKRMVWKRVNAAPMRRSS